jgi:H+/Cl- antiporter ClcA
MADDPRHPPPQDPVPPPTAAAPHHRSARERELTPFVRLTRSVARRLNRIGITRERRLLLWAALTGVTLAVIALAFIRPIQWMEHAAVSWLREHPTRAALAIAVVPVLGALVCGAIQAAFPVKIRAHGVSSVLYAIHRRRAQLPGALAARTWLGSSAIIASGGSAGPEGPIVTIGATLGSVIARALRFDPQTATTLVGCGAAAGIAAVFNAPITGIFFVLEVLLRDFSLRTFTPIVISAVFAAATVQTLIGSQEPLFGISAEHVASGGSTGLTIGTAPAFALLGVACGERVLRAHAAGLRDGVQPFPDPALAFACGRRRDPRDARHPACDLRRQVARLRSGAAAALLRQRLSTRAHGARSQVLPP